MLTTEPDVPLSPTTLLSRSGHKPRVRVLTDWATQVPPTSFYIVPTVCQAPCCCPSPFCLPCAEHGVDYDKITWREREANLLSAPTGLAAGRDKDVRIASWEKLRWRTVEEKRI